MGFVGGLIGTAGGVNGTGIAGPQGAAILNPSTTAQANTAYTNTQTGLNNQQNFLNAVQPGGLAALQSQQALLGQLGQAANGQGPNPALAQLNQTTGQNTANQAALMAGQRGSGANAGLIARQAAMQGGANQQNAAGQAATLEAQQQIAARGQLQAQQQAMAGQQAGATNAYSQAAQNEQQNILNGIAGQNNANVGMQSNINNANSSLAGISMQGQQNLMGSMMPSAGSVMSMFAEGGDVDDQYDVKPNSGEVSTQGPASTGGPSIPTIGNAFNGKSGGGGGLAALLANGGTIAPMQNLGSVPASGPQSSMGQYLVNGNSNSVNPGNIASTGGPSIPTIQNYFNKPKSDDKSDGNKPSKTQTDDEALQGYMNADAVLDGNNKEKVVKDSNVSAFNAAKGGKVPAMVSPGEQYIPPEDVKEVLKGKKDPLKAGERIPGNPQFPGNDYRNDVVPKTLKSGGVVIPNEIMQSKNPHWEAMKFVHAHMAKNRKSMPKKPSK